MWTWRTHAQLPRTVTRAALAARVRVPVVRAGAWPEVVSRCAGWAWDGAGLQAVGGWLRAGGVCLWPRAVSMSRRHLASAGRVGR
jgi:hypothetical protein